MKNYHNKAFSLVELIVVIAILLILGTIAFISLQGLTKDARDTKRLSDIKNLYSKISIENIKGTPFDELITDKGTYPVIINGITGLIIDIGKVNFEKLNENPENFKDPLTGNDYDFAYFQDILELDDGPKMQVFIQLRAYYEKEKSEMYEGNYFKYKENDSDSLFASARPILIYGTGTITSASSTYPGCDTNDINISNGNQTITIAACNVGATKASEFDLCASGNSAGCSTQEITGNYFQWGNNYPFYDVASMTSIEGPVTIESLGTIVPGEYNSSTFINGDSTGKRILGDISILWPEKTQGPCEPGYHIPSKDEWNELFTLGGWTDNNTFREDLKIPMAGAIITKNGEIVFPSGRGGNLYLSTSTSNIDYIYGVYFNSSRSVSVAGGGGQSNARPIRCFKD